MPLSLIGGESREEGLGPVDDLPKPGRSRDAVPGHSMTIAPDAEPGNSAAVNLQPLGSEIHHDVQAVPSDRLPIRIAQAYLVIYLLGTNGETGTSGEEISELELFELVRVAPEQPDIEPLKSIVGDVLPPSLARRVPATPWPLDLHSQQHDNASFRYGLDCPDGLVHPAGSPNPVQD